MQISTIGIDLAKNVFQVHGVDKDGKVVISRQLRRKQVIEVAHGVNSHQVVGWPRYSETHQNAAQPGDDASSAHRERREE